MLSDITPLILTFNEAANIGRTLSRLAWANEVVVLDSCSTDDTVAIARSFPNTRVVSRPFDAHDRQWRYGLHETGITTPWVLGLDADWWMNDGLADELAELELDGFSGFRVEFDFAIYGRKLRGALYPPVIALYRRDATEYIMHGHGQWAHVSGRIGHLRSKITHDDRKSLAHWARAQARYAALEAAYLTATPLRDLPLSHRLRRCYLFMPWLSPMVYWFVRGGVLDGRHGLVYALQRVIVELMIALFMFARRWPEAMFEPAERKAPAADVPAGDHSDSAAGLQSQQRTRHPDGGPERD